MSGYCMTPSLLKFPLSSSPLLLSDVPLHALSQGVVGKVGPTYSAKEKE